MRGRANTSAPTCWDITNSISTEAGRRSRSTGPYGIPRAWRPDGALIVLDGGYGLNRGAGHGWTLLRGGSRRFIMDAGCRLARGGVGYQVRLRWRRFMVRRSWRLPVGRDFPRASEPA